MAEAVLLPHAEAAAAELEALAASARTEPYRSAADIDGPCISVTGPDGERVYCSMQVSTSGREYSARSMSHERQLTQDPIHILMEQVRAISSLQPALCYISLVHMPVGGNIVSCRQRPASEVLKVRAW